MSNQVLLTGATGFIGRALAKSLSARGMRLRLLVRDVARAEAMGLPVEEFVPGSLSDPDALMAAVQGVAGVVHLAGLTRARNQAGFDEVNRHGCRRLVEACAAHAPEARFVLVSSLAAAGPSADGAGTDAAPEDCRPVSAYGRSKLGGEKELLRCGADLDWIVVRPPVVYGPEDDGTRMLFKQALGAICPLPATPRPLSVIQVDDLVRALELALERRDQGRFFLPVEGPERCDTDSLLRSAAEACGRKLRRVPVPLALAYLAALPAEALDRIRGVAGFFNRDKVREIAAEGWVADPGPIAAVLGFRPEVGLEAGMADVLARDPVLAKMASR